MKRIYESSRGFLEVEVFRTHETHEVWLTFFDEEGWPRHRKSWGEGALKDRDFDLNRQVSASLRYEGFPEKEAESLAVRIAQDVRTHPF